MRLSAADAPEIVEAILDGRQPAKLQLDDLLMGFPLGWDSQRNHLLIHSRQSAGLTKRSRRRV